MEAKNVMFPALCDDIFHVLTLQCLPLSIFSRLTNTVFKVFPSGSFVIDQRRAVISIWSVAFVWCLLSGFFFCIYYVQYVCDSIKTKWHVRIWGL